MHLSDHAGAFGPEETFDPLEVLSFHYLRSLPIVRSLRLPDDNWRSRDFGLYGAEPLFLGCVSPAFLSNRSEPRSGPELEEEEFWSAVDCSFRRMYSWRTRILSFAGRCRVIVFCSELSFSIPM